VIWWLSDSVIGKSRGRGITPVTASPAKLQSGEETMEHFTPIAFVASDPRAVMVPADSPYKSL
jgi:tripartite-type tricarboxylate transporter receptor subunit TctC